MGVLVSLDILDKTNIISYNTNNISFQEITDDHSILIHPRWPHRL
jgi:hypothetical protein